MHICMYEQASLGCLVTVDSDVARCRLLWHPAAHILQPIGDLLWQNALQSFVVALLLLFFAFS